MADDDSKDAALKRLGKLFSQRRDLLHSGADEEQSGINVAPQGVEQEGQNYHGSGARIDHPGEVPEMLADDLRKWPFLLRYMVAGLERRGWARGRAVELVRDVYAEAGGKP